MRDHALMDLVVEVSFGWIQSHGCLSDDMAHLRRARERARGYAGGVKCRKPQPRTGLFALPPF